ncbi:hypothetical protein [Alkalimarinus alittae]|uniref:Uncharacterized protein n=1 Tax=Alkalimarinus alittae TaxID=2961619 RepID=A0ABY6N1V4_9ALTE|nr:hypothetical protein [Alkalimarinus alittae]UZE96098.1 hypothetical protein NKI27_18945 [Alkalimarinus alittae]
MFIRTYIQGHTIDLYTSGYALTVYITFIFSLVYFLAAFNGYKYTHTHGKGVNNYQHQRNKIIAIMVPMGDDSIEYTPFDYSLDEQVVTYVTGGVRSTNEDTLFRTVNYKDDIAKIPKADLEYALSLVKETNFHSVIYKNKCYYKAKVSNFSPHAINSSKFKTPIR